MHQKCNEKLQKKMQQKNAAVWGISSAGRASALHAEGQRFDPAMLHHLEINLEKSRFLFCPKKILTCKKFTFPNVHGIMN